MAFWYHPRKLFYEAEYITINHINKALKFLTVALLREFLNSTMFS